MRWAPKTIWHSRSTRRAKVFRETRCDLAGPKGFRTGNEKASRHGELGRRCYGSGASPRVSSRRAVSRCLPDPKERCGPLPSHAANSHVKERHRSGECCEAFHALPLTAAQGKRASNRNPSKQAGEKRKAPPETDSGPHRVLVLCCLELWGGLPYDKSLQGNRRDGVDALCLIDQSYKLRVGE